MPIFETTAFVIVAGLMVAENSVLDERREEIDALCAEWGRWNCSKRNEVIIGQLRACERLQAIAAELGDACDTESLGVRQHAVQTRRYILDRTYVS